MVPLVSADISSAVVVRRVFANGGIEEAFGGKRFELNLMREFHGTWNCGESCSNWQVCEPVDTAGSTHPCPPHGGRMSVLVQNVSLRRCWAVAAIGKKGNAVVAMVSARAQAGAARIMWHRALLTVDREARWQMPVWHSGRWDATLGSAVVSVIA